MHEQLELMMMAWTIRTIGSISKGLAAIFPSQPFEERLLLLSWKRLTSLALRPRSRTSGCALADVTCEYWSHVRPQLVTPHLGFRSLGRSPTVALRPSDHFEWIDPSFSTRCGDFGYERFIGANERIPEAGSQQPSATTATLWT